MKQLNMVDKVIPEQDLTDKLAMIGVITAVFHSDSIGIPDIQNHPLSGYICVNVKDSLYRNDNFIVYESKHAKTLMDGFKIERDIKNLIKKPVVGIYDSKLNYELVGLIPIKQKMQKASELIIEYI